MSELVSLYRAHHGKVSDRWSLYLAEYDRLLAPWRDRPVRLLEIGIQNGGSLEIWGRYFPNATALVGCDIDPKCIELRYDDPRVSVVVDDACTDAGQQRIADACREYDIVIDDGSHRSGHIVDAFARYFPMLSSDGLFVAEDLHCSYWSEFEGGLADPVSSISLFKALADVTTHEHWGIPLERQRYLDAFAIRYGARFAEDVLACVHSVEFVNSMCIVRKRPAESNALGARVIVGEDESVRPGALEYSGSVAAPPDQTANPWTGGLLAGSVPSPGAPCLPGTLHAALPLALPSVQARIDTLERAVPARERALSDAAALRLRENFQVEQEVATLRAHATDLAKLVTVRDEQIADFLLQNGAPAVRAARFAERIAKRVFPPGTLRRRLWAVALRFVDHTYRYGLRSALSIRRRGPESQTARREPIPEGTRAWPVDFARWIEANEPDEAALRAQAEASPPYDAAHPLFSLIIPIYKVPAPVLEATLASVTAQTYGNWEACLAYADLENDANWALIEARAAQEPRFKAARLDENGGISRNSNAALALARGEFVVLLDHDDELTPWALHDLATKIAEVPDADFLYSDKDSIDAAGNLRQNPLFKPRWSPEMMYSVNYLTHLNAMRRSVVVDVGGWRPETDGAQDWDIFFRVAERSRRVERVEGVGYHWRIIAGSTATGLAAKPYAALGQLRTIEERVRRLALPASVFPSRESGFRLLWQIASYPSVDLVLHGAGDVARVSSLLARVVEESQGLIASVTWVRSAGTPGGLARDGLAPTVPVTEVPVAIGADPAEAFATATQGGHAPVILFLDASIERFDSDALREVVGWALLHPEIAFAGGLLLTGHDRVVEAGRIVGSGHRSLPLFRDMPLRHWGAFGGPLWYRNVSAVSPAACAFKREVWRQQAHAGLDWNEAFVAHCLDAGPLGQRGMVTPHARFYLPQLPEAADLELDPSFGEDPCFHPAFASVSPLTLADRRVSDRR